MHFFVLVQRLGELQGAAKLDLSQICKRKRPGRCHDSEKVFDQFEKSHPRGLLQYDKTHSHEAVSEKKNGKEDGVEPGLSPISEESTNGFYPYFFLWWKI